METKNINADMIVDFENYLRMEEKAPMTIEKYIRDVKAFVIYLGEQELTKEKAIEYKEYLRGKAYAVRSINSIVASLNSLFRFLNREDCLLRAIKVQRQMYSSKERELSKREYIRLIKAAKQKGNERLNLMIQTICATGIRVSELEFITVAAAKKGEATILLKGKNRTVFIVKELRAKLLRYIAEQGIVDGSVFVTRTGKPVSRTNIWKEMKNLCEQAGVNAQKVFPHNLRHLFARTFYDIEKDIAKLADVLGHSSIDTTRIYLIETGEEHKRHMEHMHLII